MCDAALCMRSALRMKFKTNRVVCVSFPQEEDTADEEDEEDERAHSQRLQAAMLHMENTAQKWAPSASVEGVGAPAVDDVVQRYLAALVKSEQFHVHATVNQFRNQALAGMAAGAEGGYQGRDAQQPMEEGDEGDAAMVSRGGAGAEAEAGAGARNAQEEKGKGAEPRAWEDADVNWHVVAAAAAVGAACGLAGGRWLSR